MAARRAPVAGGFDGDISELVKIYEKARDAIILRIAGADPNKLEEQRYRLQRLADIQNLMAETTDEAQRWAAKVVPQAYRGGVVATRKDILRAGGTLTGIADATDQAIRTTFGGIHKATVETLANNLVQKFEDIETFVGRRVNDTFRKASLEAVLTKELGGAERGQTIRDRIVASLKAEGVSGFVDKSGREWQLDRYAEMAARTVLRESATQAAVTEVLNDGYDLVEVIGSPDPDSPCVPWVGETLSLTGKTDGYPTLQEAIEGGLWHPNCSLDVVPVISDESELPVDPNTGDPLPLSSAELSRALTLS